MDLIMAQWKEQQMAVRSADSLEWMVCWWADLLENSLEYKLVVHLESWLVEALGNLLVEKRVVMRAVMRVVCLALRLE